MLAFINTNNRTGAANATPQPGNNIETLYYVPPTNSAGRIPILQLDPRPDSKFSSRRPGTRSPI